MLRPKYSFQPVMIAPLQRFVTGDRLQSTLAAAAKQIPVLRAGDELDDLFTGLDVRQYGTTVKQPPCVQEYCCFLITAVYCRQYRHYLSWLQLTPGYLIIDREGQGL